MCVREKENKKGGNERNMQKEEVNKELEKENMKETDR